MEPIPTPGSKPANGESTRFKKGDPRINRKGRPKDFDAARSLAVRIANETANNKGVPILINGKKVSTSELILRNWATSGDVRKQQLFLEIAFGKVPIKTAATDPDGGPLPPPPPPVSAFAGFSLEEIAAEIKRMEDAI